MIYRDNGDRWIDENSPVDHFPIAVGNHAAESNARRFGGSGQDAVVLRFGLFYGPGASNSDLIMDLARRHIGFQAGRADAYVSSIHLATPPGLSSPRWGATRGPTTSSTTNP